MRAEEAVLIEANVSAVQVGATAGARVRARASSRLNPPSYHAHISTISPISPPYLPHISAQSPPHLPPISVQLAASAVAPEAVAASATQGAELAKAVERQVRTLP